MWNLAFRPQRHITRDQSLPLFSPLVSSIFMPNLGQLIIGLAAEEIEEASEECLSEEEEIATIPRQPSVRFIEPILPPPATAYIQR
jgi:hypothetical protein